MTWNYLLNIPDLQPVGANTRWQIKDPSLCQLPQSLDTPVYTTDGSETFHMTSRHQEYVFRYLGQGPPLITNDSNTKKLNLSLLELCFVVCEPVINLISAYHGHFRLWDALTVD